MFVHGFGLCVLSVVLSDHVVSSGTPPWSPRGPRRAAPAAPWPTGGAAPCHCLLGIGSGLRWAVSLGGASVLVCVGVCLCLCGVFVFYCVFELVFVC